ncbi:MAG: protein tyrosine phosphatase [Raineya sp.]|jgi:predicted protein tyrosine phosphatase|nr:protein tyrosine phosphatase [Raineya sp.]
MNILFVCSANQNRSKTAEVYFQEKYPQYQFQSAGTNHQECLKNNSQPLTEELLIWADKVFVMEKHHQTIIEKYTNQKYQDKILVLNIKDVYTFMQTELIITLKEKIKL